MAELQQSVAGMLTPLYSAVRQASASNAAMAAHAKLLHALYKSSCASRRAAYDQLWFHKPNGCVRVVCRVSGGSSDNARPGKLISPTAATVPVVSDTVAATVTLKERGLQRQFQFDRVFDATTPLVSAIADIDALVCATICFYFWIDFSVAWINVLDCCCDGRLHVVLDVY